MHQRCRLNDDGLAFPGKDPTHESDMELTNRISSFRNRSRARPVERFGHPDFQLEARWNRSVASFLETAKSWQCGSLDHPPSARKPSSRRRYGEGGAVDPRCDVDTYLKAAEQHGVRIHHIFETTHLHADFVSGPEELAARAGAKGYIGPKSRAAVRHVEVHEGFELHVGSDRRYVVFWAILAVDTRVRTWNRCCTDVGRCRTYGFWSDPTGLVVGNSFQETGLPVLMCS